MRSIPHSPRTTLTAWRSCWRTRDGDFETQRLHGMGEALYHDATCAGAGLCAGRHARGSAGLPGATAAGEWRQYQLRASPGRSVGAGGGDHRRSGGSWRRALRNPPPLRGEGVGAIAPLPRSGGRSPPSPLSAKRGGSGRVWRPIRAFPCRATCIRIASIRRLRSGRSRGDAGTAGRAASRTDRHRCTRNPQSRRSPRTGGCDRRCRRQRDRR